MFGGRPSGKKRDDDLPDDDPRVAAHASSASGERNPREKASGGALDSAAPMLPCACAHIAGRAV
jgi:hypothetical protein